ncbi:EAL domain-containing protein [Methylobacterium sp. NEAU 140]|uniref:putative bifunctional diguanylate cyclase/phosphodiesterase n=1 Tax=Methylobacterium sp. NEAU 140 TaxID=3064945 RepID=UPI0027341781|nr:EAL domain-containing protein [Methylobacterium sp. NEAU 140]MDP4023942.1 EAL domain-containing protein [Methylobacterium sp. NEAU 140]
MPSRTGVLAPTHQDAELSVAQVRALERQVPTLHAILILDAVAVAWTHYGLAPVWLTIVPLCALLATCVTRLVIWRRSRGRPLDGPKALRRLRSTRLLTGILGCGFSAWALALTRYGDATTNMHVLFFLTITMIACIFCLLHLRSAALILVAIALPLTVYFLCIPHAAVRATAFNYAGVVVVMLFMQSVCYADFCRLVRLSNENEILAHTDALTGLPNRRSFFSRLEDRIRPASGEGAFAVAVIDLDGFKPVNDTLGHHAGDAVLREVGHRLEEALAGRGWAARLGGDEFGLILDGDPDLDALGREICAILRRPYMLRDATAQIGASIGIARFTSAGLSAEQLVEQADCALYHAKAHRRGATVCFAPEHEVRQRRHAAVEQALRRADLEAEFTLVYQPIVDTAENRVEAYEALARWTSPTLGAVSPADFIPVAERAGLVQDLTRSLLRRALADLRGWPAGTGLSFNLSAQDIASPENLAALSGLIRTAGVAPERIILEVTETGLMRDLGDAREALLALKDLGVQIALDDFGTGYSSLSYIHRLPIDRIKIDRSFVTSLRDDATSADIVRSVVDLARNLRLRCVVEGVETAEEFRTLRAIGCRSMQGYLFHGPVPARLVPSAGEAVLRTLGGMADRLPSAA